MTRYHKGAVPLLVVASALIACVGLLLSGPIERTWWGAFVGLLFITIFSVAFRFRIWPLADEVFDCGDHLLVRRRGEEQRIRFEDIAEVDLNRSGKSHRMNLHLRSPGKFGEKIVFLAPKSFSWNPFAADPLEQELVKRAAVARKQVLA
jgi:hypothetical protein